MNEPASDRWQLIVVGTFLLLLGLGVYFAQRKTSLFSSASTTSALRDRSVTPKTTSARKHKSASRKPPGSNSKDAVPNPAIGGAAVSTVSVSSSESDCEFAPIGTAPLKERAPLSEPLVIAIEFIETDRTRAVETLKSFETHPLGAAYLAFLLAVADRTSDSEAHLLRVRRSLPKSLCQRAIPERNPEADDDTISVSLRTVRLVLEEYADPKRPLPIACSTFRSHPLKSTTAFGVLWGNARDDVGQRVKNECAERIINQVSPRQARRILEASRTLCQGLLSVEALPSEAMYRSIHYAACDLIRDTLLAPELISLESDDASPAVLEAMARRNSTLRSRLASYSALIEREAPVLGKGLCSVLASRNREDRLERCIDRARRAVREALVSWLSSVDDARVLP